MIFRDVAIVGTGLIGTSVGIALRRLGARVTGYDVSPAAANGALRRGGIDRVAGDLAGVMAGAELVVVATPVDAAASSAGAIAAHAPSRAVVTDVGSAKGAVVHAFEDALGERFVGGHPMAGSERSGPDAAFDGIFDDAWWILTPTERTSPAAYRKVNVLVTEMGARPFALDPHAHDRLLAWLSHVPQLIATSLVGAVVDETDGSSMLALAGGGFLDVTRIAASHGRMWGPVLRQNAEAIVEALARLESELAEVRSALTAERWNELIARIDRSSRARSTLFERPDLPSEPALLGMAVPDRPGVLAQVTTAAAEMHVNIEDIRIFHSTEGGRGRLELVVSGRAEGERLSVRLQALGYQVEASSPGDEETHR